MTASLAIGLTPASPIGLAPRGASRAGRHPDTTTAQSRQATSVGKALQLLAAFRGTKPELGVSDLARRAGMPKSTAFRLLADLESAGFVARSGTKYRLGISLFELGSRVGFCRPNGLREVAMHDLSELHVHTGLTAHLGVLEGSEVVYVEKVHGGNPLRTLTTPGARQPASCSGLGKAMLAYGTPQEVRAVVEAGLPRRTRHSITEPGRFARELDRIRESGVAHDREEAALGLACVAAPIVADGRVAAAVSVSGPSVGVNWQLVETHVRRAASRISRRYSAALGEVL